MILFDFRYQDPWAEENFTLPDFIRQSQAQQRQDQQAQINRQTLGKLLSKMSLKDIAGLDHAKQYLRHKYRQNCKANTLKLELVYSATHGIKKRKLAHTCCDLLLTRLLGILT